MKHLIETDPSKTKDPSEKRKFADNKIAVAVTMFASLISPFIFYLTSDAHYFIGRSFSTAFSVIYYVLMIASAIYAVFYAVITQYKTDLPKAFGGVLLGVFVFTCLSLLFNIGYAVGFGASWYGYLYYLKIELPYTITTLVAVSVIYFISVFKKGRATIAILAIAILIIGVYAAIPGLHLTKFVLVDSATVIDTGEDYSVCWASNDISIGWLEYDYDGEHFKLYDLQEGRRVSDRLIHHVRVPYDHLKNNTYTISVQRVLTNRAYTPLLGKQISRTLRFKGDIGDDFNALILSDTHNITKAVRKKIDAGDLDVLFMLGDYIDELHCEKDISKYFLGLCYEYAKGSIPVIYARGNHEVHSEMGIHSTTCLGLDKTYSKLSYGNFDFILLDSGAGGKDDFVEFGGLADYEQYRQKQMDWLDTVTADPSRRQLLITHAWNFTPYEETFSRLKNNVERLGVKGILAGHSHKCAFYPDGFREKDEEYLRLPTLISGGVKNLVFRQAQYTKAHFTADDVTLTGFITTSNEPLFTQTIDCR